MKMTSVNINKIVRDNLQLKPWKLSKNSTEMIDEYIKNVYKQMPDKLKPTLKKVKIASPRDENMGPIKQFLSQNMPAGPKITGTVARTYVEANRRNNTKYFQPTDTLKGNTKPKNQAAAARANLTNRGQFVISPVYKVSSSRRFGSSASTSRTTMYRTRHDDRHTHNNRLNVLNNSSMCYYKSKPLTTDIKRYVNSTRNQKLESTFSSTPNTTQIKTAIVNELMMLDDTTLKRLSVNEEKTKVSKKRTTTLQKENPNETYNSNPGENAPKKYKFSVNQWPKDSIEHRSARLQEPVSTNLRINKPPIELFTLSHDRYQTELHEKHRRNRMRKLGLIERSPSPSRRKEMPTIDKKPNKETRGESVRQSLERPEVNMTKRKWGKSEPNSIGDTSTNDAIMPKQRLVVKSKQQPELTQNYFLGNNTSATAKNQSTNPIAIDKNKAKCDSLAHKDLANHVNVNEKDSPTASLTATINGNSLPKNYNAYRYNHSNYLPK